MQERRSSDRNRAFAAGRIAFRDGRRTLDCVVRDLSETGALLMVDEPLRAPRDLDLTLPLDGECRTARVVWRGETSVGVAFAPRATAPAAAPASAAIVSLAAERAARRPAADRDRLAERVARVSRPPERARPAWAWPAMTR